MTAENFALREVSADKAYASARNYHADRHGATPFIPFKANHTGRGSRLWEKMFHHFSLRREDFLANYYKRSNVESTFSMIKAKFRDMCAAGRQSPWRTRCCAKSSAAIFACSSTKRMSLGLR